MPPAHGDARLGAGRARGPAAAACRRVEPAPRPNGSSACERWHRRAIEYLYVPWGIGKPRTRQQRMHLFQQRAHLLQLLSERLVLGAELLGFFGDHIPTLS